MIKFFGILVLFVILNAGCGSSSISPGKMTRENGNPVMLNLQDSALQNKLLEDILAPVSCFQLQVPEAEALSTIDQVLEYKNQFFCADKKFSSLLVFDSGGRFVKKIGKIGKGPGKYLSIEDIFIDTLKNRLTVFSNSSAELISFGLSDNTTENMPLKFNGWRCVPLAGGQFAFYLNFLGIINNPHNFFLTDKKGKIINEDLEYSSLIKSGFEMSGTITPSGNGYLVNSAFSDTVYYGTDKFLQPAYIFNTGTARVPAEAMMNTSLFMSAGKDFLYAGSKMLDLPGGLFFDFTHQAREHFAIYHKKSKELHTSRTLQKSPLSAIFFTPVGKSSNNGVIAALSPSLLPYIEKNNPDIKRQLAQKYPVMQTLLNNSLSKTNPILIIYRFAD